MRNEKWISGIYKKLHFVQGTSMTVFIGVLTNFLSGNMIDPSVWVVTGTASAVPVIIRHFASLNHDIEATPLSDFKEYIIAEKYRAFYDRRLRGLK